MAGQIRINFDRRDATYGEGGCPAALQIQILIKSVCYFTNNNNIIIIIMRLLQYVFGEKLTHQMGCDHKDMTLI